MVKSKKKKNKSNPPSSLVSYGNFFLPPVVPGPEVEDLCKRIDDFYSKYPKQHQKQKTSDLIKGAFYAMRPECRSNTDWMSQAANSARDVLYPLFSEGISSTNLIKLFKKYAVSQINSRNTKNKEFINTFDALDKIYKQLTDLTHHGTNLKSFSKKQFLDFSEIDFENLMKDFTIVMGKAFSLQQIYVHSMIDVIVQKEGRPKGLKDDLNFLLKVNPDACQYFYSKADERWLGWLWNNRFLDVIKTKSEDPTIYGYRTPEIIYLAEMVKKVPEQVVKIILDEDTATTEEKFRPELVDQFLRMCDSLPPRQLAYVIPKIHKQKWVRLMSKFSHWGFQYERMFKVLSDVGDYKNLLLLAETVLDVRAKSNLEKTPSGFASDNPFYFGDLSYTKVFEHLSSIPEKYAEEALDLTTKTMSKIVLLGGKAEKEDAFPVQEVYYLFDMDFFSLGLKHSQRLSHRDDVRELAVVIKILVDKLIGTKCNNVTITKRIFRKYIDGLPESRTMWRLRLYVLSLCPKIFKEELQKAFFKLFDKKVINYTYIISGTEYEGALDKGFSVLSTAHKREYVKRAIRYFKERADKDPDQKWHMRYGSDILSMIIPELTEQEKKEIKIAGFVLDPTHKPTPSFIGPTFASSINPQGIITQEEFGKLSMEEITKRLKTEWSPLGLKETYKESDDFHKPHNAEGVGGQIQNDIPKRLQEYVDKAELFFERNVIDQHYTYSFFRGLEAAIKNNHGLAFEINWDDFINLCISIKKSGEENPFDEKKRDRDSFDGWLSNWTSVHDGMTDVIQLLLREENYKTVINFDKYRDKIFEILSYLLTYPDPEPKDEERETAKSISGNQNQVTDPFSMAINSVRGRAFQALQLFIFPDGRQPDNKDKVIVKDDVKKLYEYVLSRENTKALMFMFGHYLPSFYFRDIKWIQSLLPQIFPKEPEKKYLYFAAWEGYLANNLYQEIFNDPNFQELYKYSLSVDINDSGRRYFRDPDEGIAVHVALAFIHYEEFYFNHPLFKAFWNKKDPELHSQFVSFVGRSFISGNNAGIDEFLRKELKGKQRIKELWDWILNNCNEPEPFTEFGFWISLEKDIFEPAWLAEHLRKTLEKSKGVITWDYGVTKCVVGLSKLAPKDMVAVARLHFLEGQVRHPEKRFPFNVESEWIEALKILYSNPNTKGEVDTLINDLIREGSSPFWMLESILEEKHQE